MVNGHEVTPDTEHFVEYRKKGYNLSIRMSAGGGGAKRRIGPREEVEIPKGTLPRETS